MSLEFRPVSNADDIADVGVRERFGTRPAGPDRCHFALTRDGEDVGLISFDLWPGFDFVVLYEIRVTPDMRGQRTATEALGFDETFTRDRSRKRVVLTPDRLMEGSRQNNCGHGTQETDMSKAKMRSWKNGCPEAQGRKWLVLRPQCKSLNLMQKPPGSANGNRISQQPIQCASAFSKSLYIQSTLFL